VREILLTHTDKVEPLSLDEAYLDVTTPKSDLPTATAIAKAIRARIRDELHLTASAGVAPCKFVAKIASDQKKPDGLFVVRPEEVLDFLAPLPVGRLPGVGGVTNRRLESLAIRTVGDLRTIAVEQLERDFGRYGRRLHELAHGIDHHTVEPDRPTQSISAEDTFEDDVPLADTAEAIRRLAVKTWDAACKETRIGHTVVLKLKTADFRILTRSYTPTDPPASLESLTNIALSLRERVELGPAARFRLVGVGLQNFREPDDAEPTQAPLFS
jgi:DNA polymerase-4